jgi:tRNA nucleotidyltransferase/poly(A) polymerase
LEKRRLERQRTPLSEARELHVLATTTTTNRRKKTKTKKETMTMNHRDYTPEIEREAKLLGVSPHLIRGRRYYAALPPGSKKVIPREVWDICERLSGRGFKAYIVGGAVRDLLQGAKPRDFDVMTDAKYADIQHVFGWKRVRVVGRRFKVAHVRTFKPTHGRPYVEVSSCTEGDEKSEEDAETDGGGGNDDDDDSDDDDIDPSWQSSPRMYLRKDARKRDFTVNGMAYELLRNLLHDYVDGYEDLRDNIVRSIGKPHVAFKDDPARILRAIRVSAKRNMEPTKEVRATMRAYAPLLNELNRERKMLETRACLARGYSKIGMKMLWMSSTLDVLMPTVARFIKERGGRKRTMLEFQKTGFEHVLDTKSWDEEKEDFRMIFMNKDDVADDVSKKRVPSGVTAGGLFKLLENFDKYVGKDVKLTEEGVSAEFLIATLATPIALYYSGLKTVPKYSTRKRQVEVPTKKKSSRGGGGGGGTGGKKTKTVTEVNPAWLRWTAACERVLRELSEVDGLMLSSGRRSNNQGGRTYQIMTKSFMNSSSSSSSSSSASIESDDDEEKDDDFEDEDLIDYEDELGGKKYEESQASLVKIVYETFGVPETEFDEDSFKVFVNDDDDDK